MGQNAVAFFGRLAGYEDVNDTDRLALDLSSPNFMYQLLLKLRGAEFSY